MSHVFYRQPRHDYPIAVRGEGIEIIDRDGRRYLDASGGAAVSCLGHDHPRVIAAIQAQAAKLAYAHSSFFTTEPAEALADHLIARAPEGIDRVFYTSGGSEAVEAALKVARQYFVEIGQAQRTRFIARRQSYHGNTLGALSVGGNPARRRQFQPLLLDVAHVSPCYAYRDQAPNEPDAAYVARLAAELDATIQRLGPDTVIAFIAEPVVGATMGAVPPVAGYFQAVRAVCDRYGMLLILDEVMCGMGRTGTLFACEQDAVRPDLVTVAKGLGAGYQPIGATLVSRAVHDAIVAGSGFFQHGHTYMAHPTACASALAVQETMVEEQLLARVERQGRRLREQLCERLGAHPHVGDIRGRGLLQGIELVADRATRRPFPPERRLHARIRSAALACGLMCYPGGGYDRWHPRRSCSARPAIRRHRQRAGADRRAARRGDRGGAGDGRPGSGMIPLEVMVAPNGARRTKADHAKLPLTPAEIAAEAARCAAAGASILHLHVRSDDGRHTLDPDRYRAAIDAVRRMPGGRIVIQITTEAVGCYGPAEQMAVVRALRPEAVSLALTELIPDDGAINEAAAFLAWLRHERIVPQYILYTPDEVMRFRELRGRGVIPQRRPFALFVLGRYGDATEAQPRDLLPFLAAHDADSPWAVCAFGRREAACVLTGGGLGGHARVGFENNLWRADGRLAASNAELVEPVVAGAAPLLGRKVADIVTTRAFLAATAC